MTAQGSSLRYGWTTGSCATAATKAAWTALITGAFPDPVTITLPSGQTASFFLAQHGYSKTGAWACIIKDAGDDPDVTHGALIRADVRILPNENNIIFCAGQGVGTVTRPGLPIPPGEAAINPVPRQMMIQALKEVSPLYTGAEITISIPNGASLAEKTLNQRLGIIGGLSILGTTGIVVPFSCSAWIDSIHRGIDVARALNLPHIAASTGHVSETSIQKLYNLPDTALIEMGDFIGGVLKYLRKKPVPQLTIAGGIAKITKLAQGLLDLHSKRGQVDMEALSHLACQAGASSSLSFKISKCETVSEAFLLAQSHNIHLGNYIAHAAYTTAQKTLDQSSTRLNVIIFDRHGECVGYSPFL
ncbi:cobalt-precorrin-5B (C(1))-methyltransferase [Swingsia samuiensis]|uniref:Cobalt-precorrin-5B C(1)-methyltransferase n=1 Tax=Swingsia samuiensis TaxID=1293412 RepID=A0A4Y6UN28_9PROT|nr:cobalt-precorrin-5B (C(1))-methyltransferase [Swingsia samuiensis]QDH17757.1 cobalt-precorrin-5B (C(1))-methyltransferase [Swingsia samuiensis]